MRRPWFLQRATIPGYSGYSASWVVIVDPGVWREEIEDRTMAAVEGVMDRLDVIRRWFAPMDLSGPLTAPDSGIIHFSMTDWPVPDGWVEADGRAIPRPREGQFSAPPYAHLSPRIPPEDVEALKDGLGEIIRTLGEGLQSMMDGVPGSIPGLAEGVKWAAATEALKVKAAAIGLNPQPIIDQAKVRCRETSDSYVVALEQEFIQAAQKAGLA